MSHPASQFLHRGDTHLDFLKEAYILLILAYEDLKAENYDVNSKNENRIRDDLVVIAEKKETNLNFEWDTESRNLKKANRIDISLITPLGLGAGIEKRIGIECKIISASGTEYIDNKASHSRKNNPTNGIMSFVSGKYASQMPLAGMIGFIKNGIISDKIEKIKELLNNHSDITTDQNLESYEFKEGFNASYESKHQRENNDPIVLYHLFFSFTAIPHTISPS